jgi:hypothetical protein
VVTPVRPLRKPGTGVPPATELAYALRTALATIGVRRRALAWTVGFRRVAAPGVLLLAVPVLVLAIRTWFVVAGLAR